MTNLKNNNINMNILYFLTISLIFFTSCNKHNYEEKIVNVVFRYDDFSSKSSTDVEKKIIKTFEKHNATVTFGVIPSICAIDTQDPSPQGTIPLDSNKILILKSGINRGTLDIALHGNSHQIIYKGRSSEFAGLDYSLQLEKISAGKKYLESKLNTPVDIFVPPFNSYDTNTLKALDSLGFKIISAGRDGAAIKNTGLVFLPHSCDLSQIKDALNAAKSSSDTQPLVVVLFHPYDFKEVDQNIGVTTIKEFDELIKWLKSQNNIRLLSVGQANKVINDFSVNRFVSVKRKIEIESYLPSFLRTKGLLVIYHETSPLILSVLKVVIFYSIIFMLALFLFISTGIIIFKKYPFLKKISVYGSVLFTILFLLYSLYDLHIYTRGIIINTSIIGATIGIIYSSRFCKKSS